MPAAEHSLIAFPDPWVSYLCHRCLRHYITLLYGGLKSHRKRGPRFPSSRDPSKVSIGRCLPLVCQIVNVQLSNQLSGHFTLPPRIPSRGSLRYTGVTEEVFTRAIRVSISSQCQMFAVRIRERGSNLKFIDSINIQVIQLCSIRFDLLKFSDKANIRC